MNNISTTNKKLAYETPSLNVLFVNHEHCIAATSLPTQEVPIKIEHQYDEEITQQFDVTW